MLTAYQLYTQLLIKIETYQNTSDERYRYIYTSSLKTIARQEYTEGILWKRWEEGLGNQSDRQFIEKWIRLTIASPDYQKMVSHRQMLAKEVERIQEFYALPFPAVWNLATDTIVPVKEGEHWLTIQEMIKSVFNPEEMEDVAMHPTIDDWIAKNIRIKGGFFESEAYSLAMQKPQEVALVC